MGGGDVTNFSAHCSKLVRVTQRGPSVGGSVGVTGIVEDGGMVISGSMPVLSDGRGDVLGTSGSVTVGSIGSFTPTSDGIGESVGAGDVVGLSGSVTVGIIGSFTPPSDGIGETVGAVGDGDVVGLSGSITVGIIGSVPPPSEGMAEMEGAGDTAGDKVGPGSVGEADKEGAAEIVGATEGITG